MPLFQPSVLKTYLSQIDNTAVQSAWQTFQAYFGNPTIQQNIGTVNNPLRPGFLPKQKSVSAVSKPISE